MTHAHTTGGPYRSRPSEGPAPTPINPPLPAQPPHQRWNLARPPWRSPQTGKRRKRPHPNRTGRPESLDAEAQSSAGPPGPAL